MAAIRDGIERAARYISSSYYYDKNAHGWRRLLFWKAKRDWISNEDSVRDVIERFIAYAIDDAKRKQGGPTMTNTQEAAEEINDTRWKRSHMLCDEKERAIAAIIEKHCGDAEKVLQAAAKWAARMTFGWPEVMRKWCPLPEDENCIKSTDLDQAALCWIEFWRKEAKG